MAGPDCELQFHMAVDASQKATGGVLFQLHGPPPGAEAGPEHSNSEREALAVVRGLAEVK